MSVMRIGVMGCANIAWRAMLPALVQCPALKLTAVASRDPTKAAKFAEAFGCEAVTGYSELLARHDVDAVYMPLPTGLHSEWIEKSLLAGKHLLVEKSFAESLMETQRLLKIAADQQLCVMENFLFPRHSQTETVQEILNSGEIGDPLLLRASFSFPPLDPGNFRYEAALGGGALLDSGGYVLKAATTFLGQGLLVQSASLELGPTGVDISGSVALKGGKGVFVQGYFGFHSYYQCSIEFLGARGKLIAERIFTPPPHFAPTIRLEWQNRAETRTLPPDNHYLKMWNHFSRVVKKGVFQKEYAAIEEQSRMIQQVLHLAHE